MDNQQDILTAPEAGEERIEKSTTESLPDGSAENSEGEENNTGTAATNEAPDVPKGWKWDGNVEALPEPFKERGKGMLRHFTEQSEALAKQRKELEELQRQFQAKPVEPEKPKGIDPTEAFLNREYQDALESGDVAKLMQVNTQLVDYRVNKHLTEREKIYQQSIEEVRQSSQTARNQMLLNEFGQKNPRLWVHKQSGLASLVAKYLCDEQGKPLPEAYQEMERIAQFYQAEAKRSLSQTVQQKKNAVTVAPTAPVETEIVWVDTPEEERIMNMRLTNEGSTKYAKVKPRH